MSLSAVLILLLLLATRVSSVPVSSVPRPLQLPLAISNLQSKSYYGFVILLNMLNATTRSALNQDVTFLIPNDQQLAESPIMPGRLDEFVLGHTIGEPLVFGELAHMPSGTLIPTFMTNRLLRIASVGRHVFVNNAQIVAPNVCPTGSIKCHGINAVINSNRRTQVEAAAPWSSPVENNKTN